MRAPALIFYKPFIGEFVKDIRNTQMGLPLITKAEYKAYVGISSTTQDTIIDSLIPKVSTLVKTICRRTFVDYVATAKVEYHEGGANIIVPDEGPVISVTSLEYSTNYGSTYTALVLYTDYAVSKSDDTIRCIGDTFPVAINGYKLTYTAGYSTLPDDLKLAVMDLVTYYLKNDAAVHSSKAPGTNTVQIEYIVTTNLPAHIKRVLDQYAQNYN